MHYLSHPRVIGALCAHAMLLAACIGANAIAAEPPIYRCHPGTHWKNGTCVADPTPPTPPRERPQSSSNQASTWLTGQSRQATSLPTLPPNAVRPINPNGDGRNALNTQPIPPGHASRPMPKMVPLDSH